MNTKIVSLGIAIAMVINATAAMAHDQHAPAKAEKPTETSSVAKPEMVDAEVKKIDNESKKITLKHGAIKSLGMTPMTMVFQVKDAKLIGSVKAGDKVKFSAEQTKSGYVVTNIEVAK